MLERHRRLLMYSSSLALAIILLLSGGLTLAAQITGMLRVTTSPYGVGRRAIEVSLSADGTTIAFESDIDLLGQGVITSQTEVWLYNTTTNTLTRVTTSSDPATRRSEDVSLNADGTVVAFESDADLLGQGGIADNFREIWLYHTETMTYTRITSASPGATRDSEDPSINADGTIVAFESGSDFFGTGNIGTHTEIWLYNTKTMTYTRITSASHPFRGSRIPSLSADGTIVAFRSNSDFLGEGRPSGITEIWLYNTTTMTYTRITSASHSNRDSVDPSLSGDGKIVVFESDSDFLGQGIPDGQTEVWLYNTTTMTYTRITPSSDGTNRTSDDPNINEDGTIVVFESDSDFFRQGIAENQTEIWLYNTTTMTYTRVTSSSDSTTRASVTPSLNADGTVVAFHSDSDFLGQGIGDGQFEVWMFTLCGEACLYLPIVVR